MRMLYELAAKWSPSLATALVTVGVGADHAEVVALGLAIGAVSIFEAVYNRFANRARYQVGSTFKAGSDAFVAQPDGSFVSRDTGVSTSPARTSRVDEA